MAFTERIKIVIDVAGDTATRGLRNFSTSVRDADGLTNKFKAGVGSLGDSFRNLGGAQQAGLVASGISAAGVAAYSAVTKFADLGVEVGKFADATGLSAEESSRWIEVVGDLGVESGSLSAALNKLNKEIDPERFEELGIAIARTKDGATDVNGTFLNVIDRLKGMKDPAERAKVASELLGKGWQDMAEVIAQGSDTLTRSLADVSDAKVIDDGEVAKSREFRDMLDTLNDTAEDLVLTVGEALLPVIVGIGEAAAGATPLVEGLGTVISGLDGVAGPSSFLGKLTDFKNPKGSFDAWMGIVRDDVVDLSGAVERMDPVLDEAADSTDDLGDANEELAAAAEAAAEKSRDLAAALIEQVDAAIAAADASIAAADAHDDMTEATTATNAVLKDSESTLEDLKDAVDGERDAAIESATANQRLAEQMAAADGKTLSATQRLDVFNQSLMDNATNATPAARQSIYDYLIQVNQIPAEKATEILAAVAAGDLATANALLNDASRTRQAAFDADVLNASAVDTELNNIARTRRVNFVAVRTGGGLPNTFDVEFDGKASGGPVRAGQPYIVGEDGPELMVPGANGSVVPAGRTAALMNGTSGSGAGGGVVIQSLVIQNTGPNLDERALAEGIARARRKGYM